MSESNDTRADGRSHDGATSAAPGRVTSAETSAPVGSRAAKLPSSLLARTVSGAVYAVGLTACLFWGTVPTAVVFSAMAVLSCVEVFRMMRMMGRMPNQVIGLAAAAAFPLAALMRTPLYTQVGVMLLLAAAAVWHVATPRSSVADVAMTVFAPLYTSLMLSSVVFIRCVDAGPDGALLAFGVVGSVWLNDACAYFVGSRFGRSKLAPQISPHKSWEGLWGGLVGALVPWLILAALNTCGVTFLVAIPTGLCSAVAGVVGDLFESRIKRGVGVKDSGNIIPGHGGMLDRSDSLLFAVAVASLGLLAGGVL